MEYLFALTVVVLIWTGFKSLKKSPQPGLGPVQRMEAMAVKEFRALPSESAEEKCGRMILLFVGKYVTQNQTTISHDPGKVRWFEYYLMSQLSIGFAKYYGLNYHQIASFWFETSVICHYLNGDIEEVAKDRVVREYAARRAQEHIAASSELATQFMDIAVAISTPMPADQRSQINIAIYEGFGQLWSTWQ